MPSCPDRAHRLVVAVRVALIAVSSLLALNWGLQIVTGGATPGAWSGFLAMALLAVAQCVQLVTSRRSTRGSEGAAAPDHGGETRWADGRHVGE